MPLACSKLCLIWKCFFQTLKKIIIKNKLIIRIFNSHNNAINALLCCISKYLNHKSLKYLGFISLTESIFSTLLYLCHYHYAIVVRSSHAFCHNFSSAYIIFFFMECKATVVVLYSASKSVLFTGLVLWLLRAQCIELVNNSLS